MSNVTIINSMVFDKALASRALAKNAEPPATATVVNASSQEETKVQEAMDVKQRQNVAAEDQQEPDKDKLNEAVDNLNNFMQQTNRNLRFSVDHDTNQTVIQVVDTRTQEVIRQIPPQEVLDRLQHLVQIQGLLYKGLA